MGIFESVSLHACTYGRSVFAGMQVKRRLQAMAETLEKPRATTQPCCLFGNERSQRTGCVPSEDGEVDASQPWIFAATHRAGGPHDAKPIDRREESVVRRLHEVTFPYREENISAHSRATCARQ